jgi:hypothetical protein
MIMFDKNSLALGHKKSHEKQYNIGPFQFLPAETFFITSTQVPGLRDRLSGRDRVHQHPLPLRKNRPRSRPGTVS